MTSVTDAASFTGTSTSPSFPLKGGIYSFDTVISGTGQCAIYALAPDGSTFVPVPNAAFTVTGFTSPLYLAAGLYEFHISGSPSAVYASVAGVAT